MFYVFVVFPAVLKKKLYKNLFFMLYIKKNVKKSLHPFLVQHIKDIKEHYPSTFIYKVFAEYLCYAVVY